MMDTKDTFKMAAAVVSAKDELSCPICYELLVDPHTPKNLPSCGHVLCEVCLRQMVAGPQACPECRLIIKIPAGGIASLTTNYRLRSLAENHQKVANLRQGQVSSKKGRLPYCSDHEDEKMYYYCVTCNSLACQACLVLYHNETGEHSIGDVKKVYRKQKGEMDSTMIRAKSRIDEEESMLSELKTAEIQNTEIYKNVTEVCENVRKQIENCIEDHIDELKTESQELIEQVEQAKQMHIAELKKLKKEPSTVQKCIDSANIAYQAAMNASENLPDYEYITQHALLINKMDEIGIEKPSALASKTRRDVIKFVPSSSHIKIGQIISATPGKARMVKKVQTLDGFIDAIQVDCSASGLLAIADYNGKKIAIYHKVNDKYEKKLDLKLAPKNRYEPNGIAICPDGRFMVARVTHLEVYSSYGYHQNDIKIEESDGVNINRMYVTSYGRILIGDYHDSLIVEISPTGKIIQTIPTSIRPNNMTLIHDTHIAISDWKAGKVVVIDMESGQETLSIDITEMQGICYDEHTQCLLTARSEPLDRPGNIRLNTGVIEQYSYATGKLVACLQQGLYHPYGMTLTSEGHLIVANSKTVEIYEIQ